MATIQYILTAWQTRVHWILNCFNKLKEFMTHHFKHPMATDFNSHIQYRWDVGLTYWVIQSKINKFTIKLIPFFKKKIPERLSARSD